MRKWFLLVLAIGFLTMASTAVAWDFSKYSSTAQHSTFASSNYSSSSYAYAAPTAFASAWGCSSCQTLYTYAATTAYAESGSNWFSSSSTAVAIASSWPNFNCNEPEVCEDGDGDGICDESDNCIDDPNTNQDDADDDQVGDACDNCFENANTDQADWDDNGVGDVCDPTGCDGYQLPECPDGSPPTPDANCTPQYPDFGTCEPEECEDIDNDTLCDEFDNCLDTPSGDPIDDFGCPLPCDDEDQDEVCDEDDVCPGIDDNSLECQITLDCPCDADWKNHGAYVTCVVDFEQEHSQEDGIGDVVNIAGQADCGGPHSD